MKRYCSPSSKAGQTWYCLVPKLDHELQHEASWEPFVARTRFVRVPNLDAQILSTNLTKKRGFSTARLTDDENELGAPQARLGMSA
jgi:hypothetical protein